MYHREKNYITRKRINLKIRHPSRKHVNSISEMCNSGWKYTYSRFKINQALKDGGQIMRT